MNNQELNLKSIFKAEQVRLKPYYDLSSYKRELVYAKYVLDIHIERIESVMTGRWLPEKANEEFGALVTEIRGLSRTEIAEIEEREIPPLLKVLIDEEQTEVPLQRREAVERFYAASLEKFDDPKDRMIFIQGVAAIDGGEELDLLDMYHEDFNAALLKYKEAKGDD